jgi:hypothetical protein
VTTLAEVFVAVRPDLQRTGPELSAGLRRVDVSRDGERVAGTFVDGFGRGMRRVAGVAAAGFAALKVRDLVGSSIDAASDLQEAVNVTNLTFRDSAAALEGFFASSAASIGLSEAAARQASANIGGLLNNLGFTRDESAGLSKTLLTLGADMGSAFNAEPIEAIQAIGSALRGETEPIRAFNVQIDDARLKQKALELGIYSGTGALNANQKAQAALALITEQTADIQGDFANTSEGLANQQRIAAANTEDLRRKIGEGLLPISTDLVNLYNDRLVPIFSQFATDAAPKVAAGYDTAKTAAGGLYDLVVNGDFTTGLAESLNVSEDSGFVRAVRALRDALAGIDGQDLKDLFAGLVGDGDAAGESLASIADSAKVLWPLVQQLRDDIPSLSDGLNVAATVFAFAADNVDTLAKFLPALAAGFIAYKVAQIAANIAASAEPFVRLAQISANRRLAASNLQLVASQQALSVSMAAGTAATTAQTAAKSGGLLATLRHTAAVVASSVAQRAAAAASAVMTGAQWLLNAALSANPIGLVVIAIAALVAGVIVAYKNSETFRNIVNGAWGAVRKTVGGVVDWLRTAVPAAFQWIKDAFLRFTILGLIISHWGTIRDTVVNAAIRARDVATGVFTWIRDAFLRYTILGLIISHWGTIRDTVVNAATGLRDKAVAAFEWVRDRIRDVYNKNIKPVIGGFRDIVQEVRDRFESARKKVGEFTDKVKSFKLPGWVQEIADLVDKIADGAGNAARGVGRFFGFGDAPAGFRGTVIGGGKALARVQSVLPKGLTITSTYRSPAHNRRVGGSPTSLHMDRNNPAVDIGGPTYLLDRFAEQLRAMGGWRQLLWRVKGHYDHIHVAHAGGRVDASWPTLPGLRRDERPAILQVGERVVPRAEAGLGGDTFIVNGITFAADEFSAEVREFFVSIKRRARMAMA